MFLRRLLHGRARVSALAMLVAVSVLTALLWFAGRESSMHWFVDRLVAGSGGQLVVEGMHGSIYGPIRVAGIVFETGFRRVEARGLELDWSPWDLVVRRHLLVTKLRVKALVVTVKKPDKEPLQLPTTLRPPVPLQIPAAMVDRIVVIAGGRQYALGPLNASLANLHGQYQVAANAETPWGRSAATFALGDSSPFILNGAATLVETKETHPYTARVMVAGRLAEIAVSATGAMDTAKGQLQMKLTLFQKMPLQELALQASNINPQQYQADLPQADIAVDMALRAKETNGFHGILEIANNLPGTVDHGRLPLKALHSVFDGGLEVASFREIRVDLGEGGQFVGAGGMRQEQLYVDLSTTSLNLKGVHSKLKPTNLAGTLHAGVEGEAQVLQVDVGQKQYHIQVNALHHDSDVEIRSASVVASGSRLAFKGSLSLAGNRGFRGEGNLANFNPRNFGDYPEAAINATFSAIGRLSPQPQAALRVAIANSTYRGQALNGKGVMNVSAQRIWGSNIQLQLGANRFTAQGAFGVRGDRLDWELDAKDIAALGPHFGGRARAAGALEGSLAEPSGKFSAVAENLNWANTQRLTLLSAEGRLEKGLDGPLVLNVAMQGYHSNGFAIERASLVVKGRRGHHEMELAARNSALDVHSVLSGGWLRGKGWVGEITSFENKGTYPAVLKGPAKLAAGPGRFTFSHAVFRVAQGTAYIEELAWQEGHLSSKGSLEAVSTADLPRLAGHQLEIESSLVLSGKWRIAVADKIDGELELQRVQGDVTMLTEPRTILGLKRFTLHVVAANSRVSGKLDMAGTTLGFVAASMESVLTRKEGVWGVAGNSPVALRVDASIPSLAWMTPLLGGRMVIDGGVTAHLDAGGTMRLPVMTGVVTGDKLKLAYPEYGTNLRDGSLRAVLRDNKLMIEQMTFRGGDGSLSGKGSLAWESGRPVMQVALLADKLEVLSRPDRQLMLSGTGEASVHEKQIQITARLKADRGQIELPKTEAPTLSPDVVVLGREARMERTIPSYGINIDLGLDLGDHFTLKGKGLDARLEGALRVRSRENNRGLPTASGTIRVAEGSYFAYGQRLAIERGILNFNGPIDNPGLNIVALRKNQTVEAGVAITGTALAPRVTLVSNPVVSDSEKLSWLVLGHGLEGSSGADFSILQAAAGALLAQGESVSLQSRIAHAAGLDELALAGKGGLESTVLTLGKRVSSRAYLSFEQGLTGASNLVKINYELSKRLSVRAQTGTESALDLFYTFSFD